MKALSSPEGVCSDDWWKWFKSRDVLRSTVGHLRREGFRIETEEVTLARAGRAAKVRYRLVEYDIAVIIVPRKDETYEAE